MACSQSILGKGKSLSQTPASSQWLWAPPSSSVVLILILPCIKGEGYKETVRHIQVAISSVHNIFKKSHLKWWVVVRGKANQNPCLTAKPWLHNISDWLWSWSWCFTQLQLFLCPHCKILSNILEYHFLVLWTDEVIGLCKEMWGKRV